MGVYMPREVYNSARAAFISDFHHGGPQDTWIDWVSAAIHTHAKRTPETRAKISPVHQRSATRGVSRELRITTDAQDAMHRAIADDHTTKGLPECRLANSTPVWKFALPAGLETGGAPASTARPARLPRRLIRRATPPTRTQAQACARPPRETGSSDLRV
ncbi:hypothetical protein [Kytococcus sp. Marseille-QA3725]